jgi:multicomponent Na+:H+ antiporter subunit G
VRNRHRRACERADAALALALLALRRRWRRALRDPRRAGLMVLDAVAAALPALGLLLATIGLYGFLRITDIFHQLQPAGLITGPAVFLVQLASVASGSAEVITSAALVILFVLITSPLSNPRDRAGRAAQAAAGGE